MDRRAALRRAAQMLGGAISAPTLAAMLASCDSAGPSHPPEKGWTPKVLHGDLGELVATVAELIIPETDTPGARSVGVHRFIDVMLAESYSAAERDRFVKGLASFDQMAKQLSGKRFLDAKATDQSAVLTALERESYPVYFSEKQTREDALERSTENATGATPAPDSTRFVPKAAASPSAPAPFYRTMKELVLLGYYTSQAGMTRELQHQPVPGKFQGCVPLASVGRAWAL